MSVYATLSRFIRDSTAAGRALLTAATKADQRAALELGTLATQNGTISDYLTTASAASTYLTVSTAASTYLPLSGGTLTDTLTVSSGNIVVGGLTINPSNGSVTFGQTFAMVMQSANTMVFRHGNNDLTYTRPVSATSGTYSPAGYGAFGFANNANAIGVYLVPTAAGTLEVRDAAHAVGNLSIKGLTTTDTVSIATNAQIQLSSSSHRIFSDSSSVFVESTGDIFFRRSGTTYLRVNQTNATTALRGAWSPLFCVMDTSSTPIAYITQSGSTTRIRSDNGLVIRNLVDSANADLTCAAITATSLNKVTITAPATSATLTLADGCSLITSGANSLTLTTTGTTTATLPSGTSTIVARDSTDTLTNKRIQRRITSTTSASSLTPDISAADFYEYTALATGLTINNPTGTPVNGELLNFRLQDNGTGRALTWGAQFRSMTATLPTTTVANKTHRVLCEWNSGDSTWDCLAVSAQP